MENNNIQMNENTELNKPEEKKKTKGRLADVLAALIAIVVLVVCYFFWGCKYDLPATILGIVVIAAGSAVVYLQHRRASKDDDSEKKAEA